MKVLQINWSLAPERGGPTRSTIGLSKALAENGVEVVLVSNQPGDWFNKFHGGNAPTLPNLKYLEGRGTDYRTAKRDCKEIFDRERPDIVHVQGLWQMGTHAACVVAEKMHIPVVISPRGMLDPWALSVKKWKKKLGLLLYQMRDLKNAVAFHAASEEEAKHVSDFGMKQPIFMVPNGVIMPETMPTHRQKTPGEPRIAMFMSRLHPGKGLMLLVDAWAKVKPVGWKMVVAGPDNYGHKAEVVQRLQEFRIDSEWEFVGELNEQEKWAALANADLFVHPSASENFGISIAEALAAGVPVITTKGCPWRVIEEGIAPEIGKSGMWIDRDVEVLSKALKEMMWASDTVRSELGTQGKKLIRAHFSWNAMGRKMVDSYRQVIK